MTQEEKFNLKYLDKFNQEKYLNFIDDIYNETSCGDVPALFSFVHPVIKKRQKTNEDTLILLVLNGIIGKDLKEHESIWSKSLTKIFNMPYFLDIQPMNLVIEKVEGIKKEEQND